MWPYRASLLILPSQVFLPSQGRASGSLSPARTHRNGTIPRCRHRTICRRRGLRITAARHERAATASSISCVSSVQPPPAVDRIRTAARDIEQAERARDHHVLLEMRGLHHARVGRRLPEAVRDERRAIVKAIIARLAQLVASPARCRARRSSRPRRRATPASGRTDPECRSSPATRRTGRCPSAFRPLIRKRPPRTRRPISQIAPPPAARLPSRRDVVSIGTPVCSWSWGTSDQVLAINRGIF